MTHHTDDAVSHVLFQVFTKIEVVPKYFEAAWGRLKFLRVISRSCIPDYRVKEVSELHDERMVYLLRVVTG